MASYALYITKKMEHGPCHRYILWVWPEQQNVCPVEDKGKAVLAISIATKALCVLCITSKMEHFSFKSGCVV